MDAIYWKARCEAAEEALRRARTRVWVSPSRRALLAVLAELRPQEAVATRVVAQRLGVSRKTAEVALRKLCAAGLVDRSHARGCSHRPVLWKLGHLVVVQELEGQQP